MKILFFIFYIRYTRFTLTLYIMPFIFINYQSQNDFKTQFIGRFSQIIQVQMTNRILKNKIFMMTTFFDLISTPRSDRSYR